MSTTNSMRSYPHCRKIWEEALNAKSGKILVRPYNKLMTKAEQAVLISELLAYRVLDRKQNEKLHEEGQPDHGTSMYDEFKVTKVLHNGELYVQLCRRDASDYEVVEP